ncbi:hypothetical protein AYO38_05235 [bacterium SCGC AG-212-C10]|nr:hypothetical protein AYO38_05185 [bacterium SCGC AG-212-C10]OAI40771.1 hypothetical protein AYO38_05235 [bacterium SCGC AG-212-C10]
MRTVLTVAVSADVLERAAGPFPTHVKTLDAIHVATAAAYRDGIDEVIAFVTHDQQQASAAAGFGFELHGL